MEKILCIMLSIIVFTGCTSNSDFNKGKKQLEHQGYTEIKNTGYIMFCCDPKDNFSSGFIATDKSGDEVEGCICSGFLKGITIRFE